MLIDRLFPPVATSVMVNATGVNVGGHHMKIKCIDNINRNGESNIAEEIIDGFIDCVEACIADTVDRIELLGNVKETERGTSVDIIIRGVDEYSFNLATTNMPGKIMFTVSYKDSGMVGNVASLPNSFAINKIQRVIKELEA